MFTHSSQTHPMQTQETRLRSPRAKIHGFSRKYTRSAIKRWVVIALPLAAIVVAGFLPLSNIARQGLVGMTLIWYQAGWMLGMFRNP